MGGKIGALFTPILKLGCGANTICGFFSGSKRTFFCSMLCSGAKIQTIENKICNNIFKIPFEMLVV
jgi:hypothetical protein